MIDYQGGTYNNKRDDHSLSSKGVVKIKSQYRGHKKQNKSIKGIGEKELTYMEHCGCRHYKGCQ